MNPNLRERMTGIHAATLAPMRPDFSLDENALARHIEWVTNIPGIRGLLVNGHAGENFVLRLEEKRRVMDIARSAAPRSCFIVSGVNAESSLEAAAEARTLEQAGADGLLVFPPNSWALNHTEDVVRLHHEYVSRTTSIPLLIYGAPVSSGKMAYSPAILRTLAAIPRIIAIKEGSWEVARYEANRRLLKAIRPDFMVLSSGDEHLLTSYIIGSEGSQVSLAAVVPELVVALWEAAHSGNWDRARIAHEALYPLVTAIYREPPAGRATARLKTCLQILGRLECDAVRPPQPPITPEERRRIDEALQTALLWKAGPGYPG
jgi:4-hydroxy-tetrahydrodipicolinate synthase